MTTRRKTPQESFQTRSFDLTNAIAATQPVFIGQALVAGELISQNVVSMANLDKFQEASQIMNAVIRHVSVDPEVAAKRFINVLLHKSDNATLKKIAKEMAQESKSYMCMINLMSVFIIYT